MKKLALIYALLLVASLFAGHAAETLRYAGPYLASCAGACLPKRDRVQDHRVQALNYHRQNMCAPN